MVWNILLLLIGIVINTYVGNKLYTRKKRLSFLVMFLIPLVLMFIFLKSLVFWAIPIAMIIVLYQQEFKK